MNIVEAEAMLMPVGIHEGKPLGEILEKHRDYFVWLVLEAEFVRHLPQLNEAIGRIAMHNGVVKPERADPRQQNLFQP